MSEAIKLKNGIGPGEWWGVQTKEGRSALIMCPTCKNVFSLQNHKINPDGVVYNPQGTNSVGCPNCPGKYGFHELLILEGWK